MTQKPVIHEFDFNDIYARIKGHNQILLAKNSPSLHQLQLMIQASTHRTLICFAFCCVEDIIQQLTQRYPDNPQPAETLRLCQQWSRGEIKMPIAKQAILRTHACAKSIDDPTAIALFHAVGQGCSTVHTPKHAIGVVLYQLTAIIRQHHNKEFEDDVIQAIKWYQDILDDCQHSSIEEGGRWASFLKE